MVLEHAKGLADKAKSRFSDESELEEVDNLVDGVDDYEDKINKNLSRIASEFTSKKERAEQEISNIDFHSFTIDSVVIEDPYVQINDLNNPTQELFGSNNEEIDLDCDNLGDYLNELNSELNERNEEIQDCKDWLERVDDENVGEMLESSADGDDESYPVSLAKSAQVESLLTDRMLQLETERRYLGEEIVDTVDKYTEKLYEEAVTISEKLGGTKRSERGEFDILRELSRSRKEIVSRDSEIVNNSSVMHESRDALKSQAKLVDKYLDSLESRRIAIEELYEIGGREISSNRLENVQSRLDAINKGVYKLSDVVNQNEYGSVREAVEDTLESSMIDLELSYSDKQDKELTRGV